MEQVFEFFFKYRPFFFLEGDFAFQSPLSGLFGLPAVLIVAGLLWLTYTSNRRRGMAPASAWSLLSLRFVFFAVLLLTAMRPALVVSTLVPKQSILALLVDNSRSMSLQDRRQTRAEELSQLLAADGQFVAGLEENFHLRWIGFDSTASTLQGPHELNWQGEQTNIVAGLERVLAETRNLPLGGIVLFSDGSDNSYRRNAEVLAELKARKIPVHTVGVGPEQFERDVEVVQVNAPKRVMPETVSVARVTLKHPGFGGSRGRLEVRQDNVLMDSKEVRLGADSDTTTVEVMLTPKREGVQTYQFRFSPLNGEQIAENNVRNALVEVRDTQPRVLYVEGRPRWEYKFLRQAVADDDFLRLETLLRTALTKFYRQGIEEETTLAAGFPTDREELFRYQGIIVGNLESAFFSYAQMEMVRDFVGKRGGGFLMLGGSSAFSDGGYANTPIEEILPVWLSNTSAEKAGLGAEFYSRNSGELGLTPQGTAHPALQLAPEGRANSEFWSALPEVTDWNEVRGTKSGATILAEVSESSADTENRLPVFVSHRYGRGLGLAFLTGTSWRWQMLRDHEDQSHETFWRQVLRWLVSSAKDPVSVESEREIYSRNEPVSIRSEVNDEAYNRLNDVQVEATIARPDGTTARIPMQWNVREDGVYEGKWTPGTEGLHRIDVVVRNNTVGKAEEIGRGTSYFLTSTGDREYFDAVQKKGYLQQLSEETGGRYYGLADVTDLPEEILFQETQSSVVEVRELWDMPILFFLLVSFLLAEWILRKRWGSI